MNNREETDFFCTGFTALIIVVVTMIVATTIAAFVLHVLD